MGEKNDEILAVGRWILIAIAALPTLVPLATILDFGVDVLFWD